MDNFKSGKNEVAFKNGELSLAGHLYLPENFNPSKKYIAVVVGGSMTSVKEQMAGAYAAKLAQEGLVALAFDYQNYGESDGEKRQYENPELKASDIESAVSYLLLQPFVGEVAGLGVCTSAGNMAYVAAEDERLGAFATVAAWLPNAEVLPLLYGSEQRVEELRVIGRQAENQYELNRENNIIPAYSNVDQTASHVGPMEYYMDNSRGGGVSEWKNEFSVMSWNAWLDFDPMSKASSIDTPAMLVHSDGSALPNNAKEFYNGLQGQKELVWLDGNHFDFYDQEEKVNEAVKNISRFFKQHLD